MAACRRLPRPTSLLAAGLRLERFQPAYAEHREDACHWKMHFGSVETGCLPCLPLGAIRLPFGILAGAGGGWRDPVRMLVHRPGKPLTANVRGRAWDDAAERCQQSAFGAFIV